MQAMQALGDGTLREARPRFSRLAASLLATRALRLLRAINFEKKYYTTLILESAVSARVLTVLFVRSSFSHESPSRSRIFNKQEARESFYPSCLNLKPLRPFSINPFRIRRHLKLLQWLSLQFIAGRITNTVSVKVVCELAHLCEFGEHFWRRSVYHAREVSKSTAIVFFHFLICYVLVIN